MIIDKARFVIPDKLELNIEAIRSHEEFGNISEVIIDGKNGRCYLLVIMDREK